MKTEIFVFLAVVSFSATFAPANAQQTTPPSQQEVNVAVERCTRQVRALYPADDDSKMADRTAAYKACIANNGVIPGTTGSGATAPK